MSWHVEFFRTLEWYNDKEEVNRKQEKNGPVPKNPCPHCGIVTGLHRFAGEKE